MAPRGNSGQVRTSIAAGGCSSTDPSQCMRSKDATMCPWYSAHGASVVCHSNEAHRNMPMRQGNFATVLSSMVTYNIKDAHSPLLNNILCSSRTNRGGETGAKPSLAHEHRHNAANVLSLLAMLPTSSSLSVASV